MCVLVAGLEGARMLDGRTNHLHLFSTMASSLLQPVTVRRTGLLEMDAPSSGTAERGRHGHRWPLPYTFWWLMKYAVRWELPASRSAEIYQSVLETSENSQHELNSSRSEAGKVALTKLSGRFYLSASVLTKTRGGCRQGGGGVMRFLMWN